MVTRFAFTLIAGLGFAVFAWPQNLAQAQSHPLGVTDPSAATASRDAHRNSATTTSSRKARYWRHRGGQHPHYGSRRIRNR